jgi:hypothetical protein
MPWIEECKKCGQPFRIEGGKTGPMIDSEDIDCPHCGDVWGSRRIADVFRTYPLTAEDAAERARSKKP